MTSKQGREGAGGVSQSGGHARYLRPRSGEDPNAGSSAPSHPGTKGSGASRRLSKGRSLESRSPSASPAGSPVPHKSPPRDTSSREDELGDDWDNVETDDLYRQGQKGQKGVRLRFSNLSIPGEGCVCVCMF